MKTMTSGRRLIMILDDRELVDREPLVFLRVFEVDKPGIITFN